MSGVFVFLIEPLAVRSEQPLHAGGEGGARRLEDQMEVIRHGMETLSRNRPRRVESVSRK